MMCPKFVRESGNYLSAMNRFTKIVLISAMSATLGYFAWRLVNFLSFIPIPSRPVRVDTIKDVSRITGLYIPRGSTLIKSRSTMIWNGTIDCQLILTEAARQEFVRYLDGLPITVRMAEEDELLPFPPGFIRPQDLDRLGSMTRYVGSFSSDSCFTILILRGDSGRSVVYVNLNV